MQRTMAILISTDVIAIERFSFVIFQSTLSDDIMIDVYTFHYIYNITPKCVCQYLFTEKQ